MRTLTVQDSWREKFFLPTEEYLHSLISLMNELVSGLASGSALRPLKLIILPARCVVPTGYQSRDARRLCLARLILSVRFTVLPSSLSHPPLVSAYPSFFCRLRAQADPSQSNPLRLTHSFSKELSTAFGLLNLKNDSLRKRFDGIKYDVKKLEESA